jgi:hypothetical protein
VTAGKSMPSFLFLPKEQNMKITPSIHTILTRWFPEGIEKTQHERWKMTDSPDDLEKLKADILAQAHKDMAELDRFAQLASKYNLRLARADDVAKANSEALDKPTPQTKPEKKPEVSSYVRHEKSWTETVFDIIKSERSGLTIKDLKAKVAETHLRKRLDQTETAFYGAISKLRARSRLIEHKGRLYTPDTLAQFRRDVEAGLVEDVEAPAPKGQTSPTKGAILRYLAPDRSATAGEIIKMLLTNKETKKATSKDKKPVYNLLNRLTRRGELSHRDGRYRLASQKNEASPGEPGDASVNGRAATLSNESYESGFRRTLHS